MNSAFRCKENAHCICIVWMTPRMSAKNLADRKGGDSGDGNKTVNTPMENGEQVARASVRLFEDEILASVGVALALQTKKENGNRGACAEEMAVTAWA